MIRPRISPIILLKGTGSEKTKSFKPYKYLGDIVNNIRIFNELYVDELTIFDLDNAKKEESAINFTLLKKVAREANMPLCYGGGVKSLAEVEQLVNIGFEKVSLCRNALNIDLINQISSSIGSQSLVLHFDYRRDFFGRYNFYVNNGQTKLSIELEGIIDYVCKYSPGEIVFQSIELEGTKKGLDQKFIQSFDPNFPTPIKFVGGCSGYSDLEHCHKINNLASFGVGAHFILHGKYDAVLPSYDAPRFL
ncbi:HisA/HisF-related TIM barrel protein [Alphaproteobacteria bacterium]|nr:HisA/HisF-related TIM barrel protein [Alphaproteobacteria bacterium]